MTRSLAQIARRARQHLEARLARPRWVRRTTFADGSRVCILACYAKDGRVAARVVELGRAWRSEGYVVLLVAASERAAEIAWDASWTGAFDAVLARANHGYDFGSWSAGLTALPRGWMPRVLALANDSVFGPFAGFADVLARVESTQADVVGLTDSYDYWHHLQSYLVFYKPAAIRSAAFRRFWATTWAGERGDVIWHAELRLLKTLEEAGLRVAVLFPSDPASTSNPTLQRWKELIATGFPFVKVQLLRDNPGAADLSDWDRIVTSAGFDPATIVRDLGHDVVVGPREPTA